MAFDNIILSLPELLEAEQVHAFVYGLKLHIHKFVLGIGHDGPKDP